MDTLATKAAEWLKQHSASERSFARALKRFFADQAQRVADAADGVDLTTGSVPLIFHAADEHTRMMVVVRRNLAGLMVVGAQAQQRELERRRRARKFIDEEYRERFDLDVDDVLQLYLEAVPVAMRDAIRRAVDESASQVYWRAVQDGVQADIATIIKDGLDAGRNNQQTAKRIAAELGGDLAKRRAKVIARTETTGARNAGHQIQLEDAGQSDLVLGKEWLAIGDNDTRQTHLEAHGQKVAKSEPFIVGGYEAPYPGHWSLPAQERVSCRCTFTAVIAV